MPNLIAEGGHPIDGECRVGGAKNAVLPILAACVLTRRPVRLIDCPRLTDVENMLRILQLLGCHTSREAGETGDTLCIDATAACRSELPEDHSHISLTGEMIEQFRLGRL